MPLAPKYITSQQCLKVLLSLPKYINWYNLTDVISLSGPFMASKSRGTGLGELERRALRELAALERPVLTAADLTVVRSRQSANLLLSRLAGKGWLQRLRRGAYALVPLSSESATPTLEDPLAVAMRLFAPCYISGWTAAQHWDLTEQIFNSIVVYTSKRQRRSVQKVGGTTFRVRSVPAASIFGTTRVWSGTVAVEIATIHRTIIDILDAPEMGGGGRQALDIVKAYWARPEADPDALFEFAMKLGRGVVFKRLGFTAELFGSPRPAWVEACRTSMSAGVSLLDPSGPKSGTISSRWRIRINLPLDQQQ